MPDTPPSHSGWPYSVCILIGESPKTFVAGPVSWPTLLYLSMKACSLLYKDTEHVRLYIKHRKEYDQGCRLFSWIRWKIERCDIWTFCKRDIKFIRWSRFLWRVNAPITIREKFAHRTCFLTKTILQERVHLDGYQYSTRLKQISQFYLINNAFSAGWM